MKPTSIHRFPFSVTCTPQRLVAGFAFSAALERAEIPRHSPLAVFALRPRCENLYQSIRKAKIEEIERREDCLLVPNPMRRALTQRRVGKIPRIRVPVPPGGISNRALKAFHNATERDLIAELAMRSNEPEGRLLTLGRGRIFEGLEAVEAVSGMPSALLAVLNFVIDGAQPEDTSLFSPRDRRDYTRDYPFSSDLLSKVNAVAKCRDIEPDALTPIFLDLQVRPEVLEDDAEIAKVMEFYANYFVRDPVAYRTLYCDQYDLTRPAEGKKTQVDSQISILRSILPAYAVVKYKDFSPRVTGALREAVCVVVSSGVTPHPEFPKFHDLAREDTSAERPLYSPQEITKEFGLDAPYPPIPTDAKSEGWRDAAMRVLCIILVEAFQRHASLVCFEIGHIITSSKSIAIYISDSKTGFVDTPLPAWALMQEKEKDEDLDYLRRFKVGALHAGFTLETRLTEILGSGRYEKGWARQAREDFISAFADSLHSGKPSTHIARATGLSWAPVRAFLARYPEMIESPLLAPYRDHYWFSKTMVAKMRRLIRGESTHSAEIFRRIACWASPDEFFHSYCRTWALLVALHIERLALR
jgi:hypothetical protein